MTNLEIEAKVIRIVEKVLNKEPVEDDTVELKSKWPEETQKAARQIAAHANSSRGVPIIWIIGLDEKEGLVGANKEEVSNWYNAVKSCFDEGICPNLDRCLNVPFLENTVIALLFETDRVPYVIKNVAGGQITREVPWRKGNSTDSARRSDLIKILSPIQLSPVFETVHGSVSLADLDHQGKKKRFEVRLVLYVTPRTKDLIVIPYHRCKGKIIFSSESEINLDKITLNAPMRFTGGGIVQDSLTVQHTYNEIVISGPGTLTLEAKAEVEDIQDIDDINIIEAKISIKHDVESEIPVILTPNFIRANTEHSRESARWVLKQ